MKRLELDFGGENNYFTREAFNTLRTNVLFCGTSVKVIIITSCYAHEGKTTVAMDLARSLSQNGKHVLLVDADLRMSLTAGRYTKERGIVGLSQLLSGQVSTEQAIYGTQEKMMDIIFAGPYPPNPTELVGSDSFADFIADVKERYDYVLVDAPPLGLVIDAAVMAKYCDGSVLVINKGKVKYRVAQSVKEQLEKSGCKCLGVILNHVSKTTDERYLRRKQEKYHFNRVHTAKKAASHTSATPAAPATKRIPATPVQPPVTKDTPVVTRQAPPVQEVSDEEQA